ncbi:hypothetical protein E5CHR_02623 [Variovorax sp. PBL-E5]|nr:hypothetical protein E5CHR_02623 [Variovorax sp. PBL-E5]
MARILAVSRARCARREGSSKGFADLTKKVPKVLGARAGNFSGTYQSPEPGGRTRYFTEPGKVAISGDRWRAAICIP